jgi:hypothetical protein
MPAKVRFPDGYREVPSHPVEIPSRQTDGKGRSTYIERPDYDPDWEFTAIMGGYRADPRQD